MKNTFLIALLVIGLTSCSKDKTDPISNKGLIMENATIKFNGAFNPTTGISAQGSAKILSNGTTCILMLDNFMVSAGPDLKVYLSKKDTPFEFINLGSLRNNSGNDYYTVPGIVDFSVYKYVLIHCQQYNHLFAVASLNP